MTPQTPFMCWPPCLSGEYPRESNIVAYFSMEIAITLRRLPTVAGLTSWPATPSEPRRISVLRWLRSRSPIAIGAESPLSRATAGVNCGVGSGSGAIVSDAFGNCRDLDTSDAFQLETDP